MREPKPPTKLRGERLARSIAWHRRELERLTGKMVSLRDRGKYNDSQRKWQQDKAAKLAELAARHDEFCTCDECFARAKAVLESRKEIA